MTRLFSFCVLLLCAGCDPQPATNYLEEEAALRASLPEHRILDRYRFGVGDMLAHDILLIDYDTLISLDSWREVDSIIRQFGRAYYGHVDLYASESALRAMYSDSFATAHPQALDSLVARISEGEIDRWAMLENKKRK